MTKDQIRDYRRFYKEEGDEGFSPKRNKAIVDRTIKKHEIMRKKKDAEFTDKLRERTDAVAGYFKHLAGGKNTPLERYFGRKTLTHLQGRKIVAKIQRLAGVNKDPVYKLEEI